MLVRETAIVRYMTAILPDELRQERTVKGNVLFALLSGEALPEDPWQDEALCAQTDPDAFFPEQGMSSRDAKSVCAACPVRQECLEYALENDERFGVWGGLSERERRALRSRTA